MIFRLLLAGLLGLGIMFGASRPWWLPAHNRSFI